MKNLKITKEIESRKRTILKQELQEAEKEFIEIEKEFFERQNKLAEAERKSYMSPLNDYETIM